MKTGGSSQIYSGCSAETGIPCNFPFYLFESLAGLSFCLYQTKISCGVNSNYRNLSQLPVKLCWKDSSLLFKWAFPARRPQVAFRKSIAGKWKPSWCYIILPASLQLNSSHTREAPYIWFLRSKRTTTLNTTPGIIPYASKCSEDIKMQAHLGHLCKWVWEEKAPATFTACFAAPNHAGTNSALDWADRSTLLNGDRTDTPQGKIQLCMQMQMLPPRWLMHISKDFILCW